MNTAAKTAAFMVPFRNGHSSYITQNNYRTQKRDSSINTK